ncbi:MAG: acetylxylan esterase [Candidatus Poribacteria bacterium]|nr:acetylxylan esterase [Candidatus Poribacteria bacterium]
MWTFDLPLEDLKTYKPPRTAQPDFDEFWERTKAEGLAQPLNPELKPIDYPVKRVQVFSASFDGYARGSEVPPRVGGWYFIPEDPAPRPALVIYHGYHGYRDRVATHLHWALLGFVVLAMDVRGRGEAPDWTEYSGGHWLGWMTRGIMDKEEYFYRLAYIDCVRAVEFIAERPEVDAERIGVLGGSQGGALSLAVAALSNRPAIAMPMVPYLCNYPAAVKMARGNQYGELNNYFIRYPEREVHAMKTLSYFDNLNLAPWISCPTLVSVGLRDIICPPSTVFSTYNYLTCKKEIAIYPYDGHSGGGDAHREKVVTWAHRLNP